MSARHPSALPDRKRTLSTLLAGTILVACGGYSPAPPTPAEQLKQRPYTLRVPAGLPAGVPAPLVIGLHGYGGTSDGFEQWWQLGPSAGAKGVLYVALDGLTNGDGFQRWNAIPLSASSPYDLQYIDAVIEDIAGKAPLDRKRVYVVGASMGAFMAYRLACELSSKVAAIVSLSGQGAVADQLCPISSRVSVLEVHGDHDSVIDYDAGALSSKNVVEAWGERDGCTGRLQTTGTTLDLEAQLSGEETALATVQGCPQGVSAELWTVRGGEHHPDLIVPAWGNAVIAWLLAHPKAP
jgi:polyhydroxybutyrate depolymerase